MRRACGCQIFYWWYTRGIGNGCQCGQRDHLYSQSRALTPLRTFSSLPLLESPPPNTNPAKCVSCNSPHPNIFCVLPETRAASIARLARMKRKGNHKVGKTKDAVAVWVFSSPRAQKKLRVVIPSLDVKIDFGQRGASDFTRHKDASRMLRYLRRHAANISRELQEHSSNPRLNPRIKATFDKALYEEVLREGLNVDSSRREYWNDFQTRGFWSRWLLWSLPSRSDAIDMIEKRFNLRVEQSRPH